MSDNPNDFYDRNVLLLPDGRLTRSKPTRAWFLFGHKVEMEPVFCVNCGAPGGLALNLPFMFYLCDKCEKWGTLPVPTIPDEIARGQDASK
ncbi:MAG: hypothetical protein ACRDGM_00730 [bacterium]